MSRLEIRVSPKRAALVIDGNSIRDLGGLCLASLVHSAIRPGDYYLFVCGCGEAGCGGYGPVTVAHEDGRIFWHIDETLDGEDYNYTFTKSEVLKEMISGLKQILSHLHPHREDCFYSPSLTLKTRISGAIDELEAELNHRTEQDAAGQPATPL